MKTIKEASKLAFKLIYSPYSIILDKKPKLDMRYNFSKLILKIYKQNALTFSEKKEILSLRKQRRLSKNIETNYLNNPILVDYIKNKKDVKHVFCDRIEFYGRNHWAKNNNDLKVISIIKKYAK